MIVGDTIFKMDGTPFLSPEFPRGGLAGTFVADVTQIAGTPSLTISIQHRDSEDQTFTTLGSFDAITAAGAISKDLTGLKEIVRFMYQFDAGDNSTDGVHFLMMAPSWRPY